MATENTTGDFQSHYFQTSNGKMHYYDEGQGSHVLLFVHGTPVSSWVWRHQIKALRPHFRCIAADHLGFGLSDKPKDYSYHPSELSKNLEQLMDHLKIEKFTLVVHDFGGPIGLAFALREPSRLQGLILLNTWLWKTTDQPGAQKLDKMINSPIGRFLYLYMNFSAKMLIKKAFSDPSMLPKAVHRKYISFVDRKAKRIGHYRIAQWLFGASEWYEEQGQQLEKLQDQKIQIIWGKQDPFIKADALEKWKSKLPQATVMELPSGHFIQEENARELSDAIFNFMQINHR